MIGRGSNGETIYQCIQYLPLFFYLINTPCLQQNKSNALASFNGNSLHRPRKSINFATQTRDKPTRPSNTLNIMMNELRVLTTVDLQAMAEKFNKYRSVLFHDPAIEETDLWFAFMRDAHQDYTFALYALNTICDSLIMAKEQPMREHTIIFTTDDRHSNGLALGYQNKNMRIAGWPLVEYGIDTLEWAMLVRDTDNGKEYNIPINRYSANSIISVIAALRHGNTEQSLTFK